MLLHGSLYCDGCIATNKGQTRDYVLLIKQALTSLEHFGETIEVVKRKIIFRTLILLIGIHAFSLKLFQVKKTSATNQYIPERKASPLSVITLSCTAISETCR